MKNLKPMCGRLSWLPVSFLLHVKYTLSYRIVEKSSENVRKFSNGRVKFGNCLECGWWWSLTIHDRTAHNFTEWSWTLDVQTHPRFFSNLCKLISAKVIVKVWTLAIAPLTWVRLVTSSALQSRKWQLIGPMVLHCIMWPSIGRANVQLDPRCS